MPRYLVIADLRPAGLTARRSDGFKTGAHAIAATWASVGGSVERTYYTVSAEWDVVGIVTVPSSDSICAVASAVMASGVAEQVDATELRTGDEADTALAIGAQYVPPGALSPPHNVRR